MTTARPGRRPSCSRSSCWSWSSARRACSARRRAKDERQPRRADAPRAARPRRRRARALTQRIGQTCMPDWAWARLPRRSRSSSASSAQDVQRGPLRRDHHDARLRDDGARPQHRGRLRGPARPRIRRVLRDRRVRVGLAHVGLLRRANVHFVVSDIAEQQPGIHINFFVVIVIAGGVHRDVGRDPRRAHAAPARRLPGDRDARVRRDRAARVRAVDGASASAARPLQRPPGHHAGRPAVAADLRARPHQA